MSSRALFLYQGSNHNFFSSKQKKILNLALYDGPLDLLENLGETLVLPVLAMVTPLYYMIEFTADSFNVSLFFFFTDGQTLSQNHASKSPRNLTDTGYIVQRRGSKCTKNALNLFWLLLETARESFLQRRSIGLNFVKLNLLTLKDMGFLVS